ncbi:hypothetical protein [Methanobacterium spitsbergense]|uniref:Uncharacterized protein n=1 Tax=Methanobacterium spitsbergense TaxID=2874285 RepID=A0A8T5UZV5_9EURY|nr:hypothetical protein [Methanobacterium spitsbergense]MBZ2166343.1 hypothetical protein [Methanobacterium spitsbergense]
MKDYSYIQTNLEGLYALEGKFSVAFGTYNFQMKPMGMSGKDLCKGTAQGSQGASNNLIKPNINIDIKPTFPEPKPVKVAYGVMKLTKEMRR